MNTTQTNRLIMLLVALTCLPFLVEGQFKDFRRIHTENFNPNKWKSGALEYYENGYTKYEYKDLGKERKKRFEYYEDGTLMSEMEVIFKFSRDTIVTFSPETYQEVVQIVEDYKMLPDGPYLEYHEGQPDGKRFIHLKGNFKDGKKTGTWITTNRSGKTTKTIIEESDTNVNHKDYKSYNSIQDEKRPKTSRTTRSGNPPKGKFTYKEQAFEFIYNKFGLAGIVDHEQNEIVDTKYKYINTIDISKGILILQDEKFHLLDLNTKTIIADKLDNIKFDYKHKLYFFTREGKKGIIDPETKQIVVPAKYNQIQSAIPSYGLDRKVILLYDNKGIDLFYRIKSGDFHYLEKKYEAVTTFSLPKLNYALLKKNNVTKLITLDSLNTVFTYQNFQDIKIALSGHVFIKSDDTWAVYKQNFKVKNPGKFQDFHYVNNGDAHIEVKQNGLWGALDQHSLDSLVIPCQYDSLSYAARKTYKVYNKQGKVGLINYQREVLVPMEYEAIYTSYALREKYWVKENGKYRLFDGEQLNLFDRIISYFNRNFYIVQNEGKQGLYSESANQMIIPCEYDSIYRFKYGRSDIVYFKNGIALEKGPDLFFADLEGKMLSEYVFRSIVKVPTDCELIAKDHNDKSHVISTCDSEFELPPIADSIRHVEEGAYVIANNGKFGFFSSASYFDYKVTLPMEYEEILWYLDTPGDGSKLIMAKKDGKWLWINPETGKNNFPYVFDRIERFYDGRQADKAQVVLDGKKKFLRLNGTLEDR